MTSPNLPANDKTCNRCKRNLPLYKFTSLGIESVAVCDDCLTEAEKWFIAPFAYNMKYRPSEDHRLCIECPEFVKEPDVYCQNHLKC